MRKELFVKVSHMLNGNGIAHSGTGVWEYLLCMSNSHYNRPPLLWDRRGFSIAEQRSRHHLGACMDHTVWQGLDCGQSQGLLSLSFSPASNSVPHRKERGSLLFLLHFIVAKNKVSRGYFAWN